MPNPRGQYVPDFRRLRGDAERARGIPAIDTLPSSPPGLGQATPMRLPAANFPPAGARANDPIGDAFIAPGASATLVTVPVPDNLSFVVWGVGFNTDDPAALGYLTWAILLGPDPSPSYENMQAAIGSVRQLATIFVFVGASQTLTVRATVATTAPITYRYICHLRGWYFSEKEA